METPTYKLDRQGYISHERRSGAPTATQEVGSTTNYLCGISVAYKDRWVYSIYWTTDRRHALSVFNLCKVWEKIASNTMECEDVSMETLVGTTSSYVTHELPYKLSAGVESLYLNVYNISIQR